MERESTTSIKILLLSSFIMILAELKDESKLAIDAEFYYCPIRPFGEGEFNRFRLVDTSFR